MTDHDDALSAEGRAELKATGEPPVSTAARPLSPDDVETLKLLDDKTPLAHPSWWQQWVVVPLKRSHWIFRIGDFIVYRLELQDRHQQEIAALTGALKEAVRQVIELSAFLSDARQRLLHHEQGPLKGSRAELDRRRGDGMLRPMDAKRNGKVRSVPALVCVHNRPRAECVDCSGPTVQ